MMRKYKKIFHSLTVVLKVYTSSILILLKHFGSYEESRMKLILNQKKHMNHLLDLLGIKVNVFSSSSAIKTNELLSRVVYVANHQSLLDFIVLNKVTSGAFITSQEMRETPILGFLSYLGGCFFVERRSKRQLPDEVKNLTQQLNHYSLIYFPESTVNGGLGLLPFKSTLFEVATVQHHRLIPIAIEYIVEGKKIHFNHTPHQIFWRKNDSFIQHAFNILDLNKIQVNLYLGDPLESPDKKILCQQSYQFIQSKISNSLDSHV